MTTSLNWVPFDRHWSPVMCERHPGVRPPVGKIIAWERSPVRVVRVETLPPPRWEKDDFASFEHVCTSYRTRGTSPPSQEEWVHAPYLVWLQHPASTDPVDVRVFLARPYQKRWEWFVLPEHYAVCVVCFRDGREELAPCRHHIAEKESQRAAEILEHQLSVMPGCCWGCHEVVTERQKSIAFDGDNVVVPGGPPVVFHLREMCSGAAERYEEAWVEADPRRRRRLKCVGRVVLHLDGDECSEGVLCPGGEVSHGGMDDHRWILRDPKRVEALQEGGVDLLYRYTRCSRCRDAFERGDWAPQTRRRRR